MEDLARQEHRSRHVFHCVPFLNRENLNTAMAASGLQPRMEEKEKTDPQSQSHGKKWFAVIKCGIYLKLGYICSQK